MNHDTAPTYLPENVQSQCPLVVMVSHDSPTHLPEGSVSMSTSKVQRLFDGEQGHCTELTEVSMSPGTTHLIVNHDTVPTSLKSQCTLVHPYSTEVDTPGEEEQRQTIGDLETDR